MNKNQKYYNANKTDRLEYSIKYYENNHFKINQRRRERVVCSGCLKTTTMGGIVAHNKTKYHKETLQNRKKELIEQCDDKCDLIMSFEAIERKRILADLEDCIALNLYPRERASAKRLEYHKGILLESYKAEKFVNILEDGIILKRLNTMRSGLDALKLLYAFHSEFYELRVRYKQKEISLNLWNKWQEYAKKIYLLPQKYTTKMGEEYSISVLATVYDIHPKVGRYSYH